MLTKNPREAAFLAMLASNRDESFIDESLEVWRRNVSPPAVDFHLAQQLANGATQRSLSLDYIATQLADKKKLSLKPKERLLVRLALYQYYFLERIPLYAISNEMVALAKKHCHKLFANFLNAILQKLSTHPLDLPQGSTINDLSIRYSYPPFYVDKLLTDYGLERTKQILTSGNLPSPVMFRLRKGAALPEGTKIISTTPCPMGIVTDIKVLPHLTQSSDLYIQNATPATLITEMCHAFNGTPKRILDLCASPGGKLFAAHDFFPHATLYGNDVSEDKIKRLSENCSKYGVRALLSSGPGEFFTSTEYFDIIILDVPCSNSGVLNKRSEARWRLSQETLNKLKDLQLALLKHALTLLAPMGELWYLTCSILSDENEKLISEACQKFQLKIKHQATLLPHTEGWDGGYGCIIKMDEG